MFEDILGETTDVNINFQVPSRRNCVVTFFKDSIYISGGMDSNGHSSNRVDRVNPFSGNVSSVSPMSHARYGHCAAANDQYLFVFGGYSGLSYVDECEKYDAIHNRWTRLPDMIATRSDAAAVNVPSVGIVVVGGYLGDINVKVDIVELLAPSTEGGKDWSWQTLAPMLQWRRSPAVEYFRGCIIVAGGNDGEHITVECLPMTPDCRYSSQWTQLAEVPHSRSGAISLAAFNGRLLFYNSNIWLKLETGFPFFVLKSYRGKDEVLEFLPESETNESELEEFTWKPLFTRVAYGDQRLLVLRKRL
uniref:BACK domain-containing protein n=1 Tax=Mesocestoides corti TaxID=53468 RepID=A0A5K3FV04_MESCO